MHINIYVLLPFKATRLQLANWAKTTKRSIPGEISETEDKLNALFGKAFTETTIA